MKLSPLLAQYLLANNRLSLAGIGHFLLEENQPVTVDNAGDGKVPQPTIRFRYNPAEKKDEELVSFVASQTGKMKSLAEADINSFIDQVKEFLNIGKPFLFEGIGTLSKMKGGILDFTPAHIISEKNSEATAPEDEPFKPEKHHEDASIGYHDLLTSRKPGINIQKRVIIAILIITGLGLAVWGGYSIVKQFGQPEIAVNPQQEPVPPPSSPDNRDDSTGISKDTTEQVPATGQKVPTYKFIVKEAGYKTALRRYLYLKEECKLDVYMSTRDSALFKVFFQLPASPADTARMKDSLNLLYISQGQRKVHLEKS
ncbi:MAG: hypothetical protein GC171_14815 [Terrimonas sp.]|nr:hypothetical protein [Terrimonas sp.]